ncbi:hypothetical protein AKJ43_03100 [candidate division MSBL1 archaeon SCGC-AAA261D19]|uniref:Uncharacterized protein n=1 Tax=candidate division MSBL1 archaeon SCGC-AAA261D19 TaxID=1698273 RepID=A0A133V5U0_9EURY|nr:hypothetical protein AKJ43_03100 [candidate division MSBL1 archaeon SCGC-AAA261D19]
MSEVVTVYKPPDKSKSVQISRALNGYKDRSNYGKYSYERKGLLEKIPHRKFAKNVLLLREEDHKQLIQILEKYEAEYYAGFIEKTSEAGEILSR